MIRAGEIFRGMCERSGIRRDDFFGVEVVMRLVLLLLRLPRPRCFHLTALFFCFLGRGERFAFPSSGGVDFKFLLGKSFLGGRGGKELCWPRNCVIAIISHILYHI